MWTRFFNRIFLINLPEDKERLERSSRLLGEYKIPFKVVKGIRHENGEEGIRQTVLKILESCKKLDRILIFEDDVKFQIDPNLVMEKCVHQLKKIDWHLFYMGPNTHRPFTEFYEPNLLKVQDAYGLHATAYSKKGMEEILKRKITGPIDVFFAGHIQTLGKSYCSFPLIATQFPGYSNIQKKHMEQDYIEKKYYQHIKHLI
jgi:GR25 family glycosyltransferase involved in LPS biosynthesis